MDGTASIELVSSDLTGHIIHWDITIGNPLVVLQDGTKPVLGRFCFITSICFVFFN